MTGPLPPTDGAQHTGSAARDRTEAAERAARTDAADTSKRAGPLDPAAVQRAVAADRARLLAGRGPGASQAEIDRLTRARPQLANEATPQHLETVARQTALARGDAAALALDVAETRDQLAGTLGSIRDILSPQQAATRAVRGVKSTLHAGDGQWPGPAAGRGRLAVAAVAAVAAIALVRRRRR